MPLSGSACFSSARSISAIASRIRWRTRRMRGHRYHAHALKAALSAIVLYPTCNILRFTLFTGWTSMASSIWESAMPIHSSLPALPRGGRHPSLASFEISSLGRLTHFGGPQTASTRSLTTVPQAGTQVRGPICHGPLVADRYRRELPQQGHLLNRLEELPHLGRWPCATKRAMQLATTRSCCERRSKHDAQRALS